MALETRHTNDGAGAPRWEPIARLAIRLSKIEPSGRSPADSSTADASLEAIAAELVTACRGNDILLREALAVFAAGADRGVIGARAAAGLRLAIRQVEATQEPFGGIRLRGRRRRVRPAPIAPADGR